MCERFGYWRWLGNGFRFRLKLLSQQLRKNVLKIPWALLHPFLEYFVGFMCCIISLVIAIAASPASSMPLAMDQRVFSVLMFIPSFLLLTHGIYRGKDDC